MMTNCKNCKHDGYQMIFKSGCTGCGGDSEYLNFKRKSAFKENEAAYHLENYQNQIDADGVMVGVSRQALDEVLNELAILRADKGYLINKLNDVAKDAATEFYYHWHNSAGTNTQQGFDDWWEINKARFIFNKA